MQVQSKARSIDEESGEKVYDSLAIPKRKFNILLLWLLVGFLFIVLYLGIILNALAYSMLVLLPLIAFLRPEQVPQKKKSIGEKLHKIKTVVFWGGLSAVIFGIQMGLFTLILQEFVPVEEVFVINGELLLYFIFPLTTVCFDVIIFNVSPIFHQNEQHQQYSGWKKEKYSQQDAENIVNVKFRRVLKICVALTIISFVFLLLVILVLNLADIIPTPSTAQFILIVALFVIVVAVVSVRSIKKKMISNQLHQLNPITSK